MTAPLFLIDPPALDGVAVGDVVVLDGAEGRHAATVRRLRVGESLDVADGVGRLARCRVAATGPDRLDLTVTAVDVVPEPALRVTLVQALAKGGRDELAVETATEVGVDAVVPWQAARSVVVWHGDRGERARTKWAATARAAAKQSRRPRVPRIEQLLDTPALVRRCAAAEAVFVLHEGADERLSAAALPAGGEVMLVVGPEGGVDERELTLLRDAGARAVRLGSEVLRSSTAGAAALAVLAVRTGRW